MTPRRTGLALAVTVGVLYGWCTLSWALAPGPFPGFMNSRFHGMNFSSMVQQRPFEWLGFIIALLMLYVWGLFTSSSFGCLLSRLTYPAPPDFWSIK